MEIIKSYMIKDFQLLIHHQVRQQFLQNNKLVRVAFRQPYTLNQPPRNLRRDTGKNYFSLIQFKQKFPLIHAPDSLIDLC